MVNWWKNKRVMITGHTGFKGAWLTVMLKMLGAEITGYGLAPLEPSLFSMLYPDGFDGSTIDNIVDGAILKPHLMKYRPEIVFHMAAQAEMKMGYDEPLRTFEVNTIGTVRLLDILREIPEVKSIVVVTTDKVYKDTGNEYSECSPLGGNDPYSLSKAAADMVAQMYEKVYLHGKIAIARSGNVIGGGDWAKDRLIPNVLRAIDGKHELNLYDPSSTRPWQHVMDCLNGYLLLAKALYSNTKYARAFNFAPDESHSIKEVVDLMFDEMGVEPKYEIGGTKFVEALNLSLDCHATRYVLGWKPVVDFEKSVRMAAQWHKKLNLGENAMDICHKQLLEVFNV